MYQKFECLYNCCTIHFLCLIYVCTVVKIMYVYFIYTYWSSSTWFIIVRNRDPDLSPSFLQLEEETRKVVTNVTST